MRRGEGGRAGSGFDGSAAEEHSSSKKTASGSAAATSSYASLWTGAKTLAQQLTVGVY